MPSIGKQNAPRRYENSLIKTFPPEKPMCNANEAQSDITHPLAINTHTSRIERVSIVNLDAHLG